MKGERTTPGTEERKFGNIVFAAISLPVEEIKACLREVRIKISCHAIVFGLILLEERYSFFFLLFDAYELLESSS